jgi:hypothetical protein
MQENSEENADGTSNDQQSQAFARRATPTAGTNDSNLTSTRNKIRPHSKKKSSSQALLRAKASLPRLPASIPSSFPAKPRHGDAQYQDSQRSRAASNGNSSGINESLPTHRNFGIRSSSPNSNSSRSTISATACESKISTAGEWKVVHVNVPSDSRSGDIDIHAPPCTRSLHAAAGWTDQMFIFGGYDGQTRRNDFYSFHFKNQQWKLLNADTHGIRGQPPSPRDRHCAVVYKDAFYVFGGFDGSARVNDFYKYDIMEQEWTRIVPNEEDFTLPTCRHSHSAVVHKDSMWVFGGYDGSYRCDLYEYNFLTNIWTVVDTGGRIPRPRYRATCVIYNDCLILHGGHDGTRHLEDTNVLDLETKRWTNLVRIGNAPTSRDSHVSFTYNNAMYVFGGSAGGTAMNDMYELSMETSEDGLIPIW